MKNKFSKKWISSSQTRKQRKYRMNAPLHISRKMIIHWNLHLRKQETLGLAAQWEWVMASL